MLPREQAQANELIAVRGLQLILSSYETASGDRGSRQTLAIISLKGL